MEDIQMVLEKAGVLLTFTQCEIYGIPGFQTESLVNLDTNYEITKQAFTFQVSTLDLADNGVQVDDEFTIDDTTYTYTFSLTKTPVPDLTGYSKLYVDYISKVLL
jgi:hypothetical protein